MKNLAFIFSFIFGFGSFSHALGAASVGKIKSGVCGSNEEQLQGSGVIIDYNREKFVVTSEHVIIAMASACHSFEVNGQSYNLEFVFSNYRNGLALLKIKNGDSLAAFQMNQIETVNSSISGGLMTVGYPANSKSILVDKNASVVSLSNRSPFIDVNEILEINGLHAEYGMSGGVVLSADGTKVIGILSHLKASGGITNNKVSLAIPAQYIKSAFLDAQKGQVSTLRRAPRSQGFSGESVLAPGLRIQSLESSMKSIAGGGDGMGIGGGNSQTARIIIEQTDFADLENGSRLSELSWLKQIKSTLHTNSKLEIEKIVRINSITGDLVSIYPQNISEFIREMKNPESIIIIKGNSKDDSKYNGPASPIIERLINSENPNEAALGKVFKTILDLRAQNPGLALPMITIKRIKDHQVLTSLAAEDFDNAVVLQKELTALSMSRTGL